MKYLMLIMFMQFVSAFPGQQIPSDDPRPPSISQPMTKAEIATLKEGAQKVYNAQLALDEANANLLMEKRRIIEAHRTKDTPAEWCSKTGYIPSIVRGYVVWTLGMVECHPV